MKLARMQDIAGCRLIFESQTLLYAFRDSLNKNNRFAHILVNDENQYDYIKNQKYSGYRGVHDVYKYQARTVGGNPWNGLMVEIQYRTLPQHAWATAVEIAGNISTHQPKFDRGDEGYIEFFKLSSEIIARHAENQISCYSELTNYELCDRFEKVENSTGLLEALNHLRPIDANIRKRGNFVMYFGSDNKIHVEAFENQIDAIRRLFVLEETTKESPVIARADNIEALKSAYRNYFSDANDFVAIVRAGLSALSS